MLLVMEVWGFFKGNFEFWGFLRGVFKGIVGYWGCGVGKNPLICPLDTYYTSFNSFFWRFPSVKLRAPLYITEILEGIFGLAGMYKVRFPRGGFARCH